MKRIEPPKELRGKIFLSIQREELHRARIYVRASLATTGISMLGIIFAVRYMVNGFYQTSFHTYFSLLFSDPDIALSYWREFSLSLIETLPLLGITLSLVAIAALLASLLVFTKNIKKNFTPSFG